MELPALGIPVAYGGAGRRPPDAGDRRRGAGTGLRRPRALSIIISKLGMVPIMNWGTEDLKSRYLHRVASGESQASYCLSESDAGSDVAAMRCRAVRDGDHYVLSGSKYWITNAGVSDIYTVFAKTDPDGGQPRDVVLRRRGGLGRKGRKARDRRWGCGRARPARSSSTTCTCRSRTVSVRKGTGSRSRCTPSTGAGRRSAPRRSGSPREPSTRPLRYMHERKAFGNAIADFQGLRFMIAEMAMRTEAARSLVYRACSVVDAGDPDGELRHDRGDGQVLRFGHCDVCHDRRRPAFGGYGYTTDFPVERFMRDAKVTQIYEGTNQIQRVVISKKLLS